MSSNRRAVISASDYAGPYGGNFIPAQLALASAAEKELGLASLFVFSPVAKGKPWLADIERQRREYIFLDLDLALPKRVLRLRSIARERNAVLLHSHFTAYEIDCALASRLVGARCLWHIHLGFEGYPLRQRVRDLAKIRAIGRSVDLAVAVSPQMQEMMVRRGFARERTIVIPNGVALERLSDVASDRMRVRQELDVADRLAVLAFCHDPERKGTDVLMDAGTRLRHAGVDHVTLVLVGTDALRTYVDSRTGGDPPPWLRVVEPRQSVHELYAAADVFVSASRSEGMPYAIAEALAAGLPVITSSIPGIEPYLDAPALETFVSGDASALAQALERMAAPGYDTAGRGRENAAFASRALGLDGWVEAMLARYRDLLRAT